MADFEAWLVFLILVVNVVGELQRKRTLAASRGFLAAARLSCFTCGGSSAIVPIYGRFGPLSIRPLDVLPTAKEVSE